MKQTLLKNNGFSITESLVALFLLSLVVISGFGIFNYYFVSSSSKSRVLSSAFEIEGAILASAQDISKIRPISATLLAGQKPMQFQVSDSNNSLLASISSSLLLDENKKICTNVNLCKLKTTLDIKCFVNMPYPDCRMAYQIDFLDIKNLQTKPTPIGALALPFKDEDYNIILAYDVFSQEINNSCESTSDNFLLTGYNKNTGAIQCASTPNVSCANSQIPVGLTFLSYPSGGGLFEMKCSPTLSAICPTNYALSAFSAQAFDSRISIQPPDCIFIGQDKVAWASSVSGSPPINNTQVCTNHYETTQVSCSLTWVDSPVTCGTCSCNCTGGDCSGTPPNQVCTPVTCQTCGGEGTLYPNHGSCNVSTSGPFVSASVSMPGQPSCACGGSPSTIATNMELNGFCQLKEPQKVKGKYQ